MKTQVVSWTFLFPCCSNLITNNCVTTNTTIEFSGIPIKLIPKDYPNKNLADAMLKSYI